MGPEAGHLNITGMSGLSTKTSHALFTISSIFQTAKDKKVAALMFNVKGADLLYLDKPVEVDPEEDPRARRPLREGRPEGPPARGPGDVRGARSRDGTVQEPHHLRAARLRPGSAGEHRSTRRTYRREGSTPCAPRAVRIRAFTPFCGTSGTYCRTPGGSSTPRTTTTSSAGSSSTSSVPASSPWRVLRGDQLGLRLLRRQRQLVLERAPPGDHRQGPQPLRRPAEQVPGPPW